LTEILASHLAGVPSRKVSRDAPAYEHALAAAKIDSRAFKMGLYGFFVSAPLNHLLVGKLQKAFAGKTDPKSKVLQILASNLLISPIIISGAYRAASAL
jgi:peroxisomal membrane protein 2